MLKEHGVPIAPSTYYARRAAPVTDPELQDAYLANALLDVWTANRNLYGLRKCRHAMRRAGHDVGRDQVARLMGIVGIDGIVRGRRTTTTTSSDDQKAARQWATPAAPDQWWVADFT